MSRRGEQARVVWLNGVLGWGLSSAALWCVTMALYRANADSATYIPVALIVFPIAGYIAGGMMWQDRQSAECDRVRPAVAAEPVAGPLYAAAGSSEQPQEIEATWLQALQVWWSLTWRGVIAMFASVVIGTLLGVLLALMLSGSADVGSEANVELAQVLGGILGAAMSIIPVKLVLGKDFNGFRLALLAKRTHPTPLREREASGPSESLPTPPALSVNAPEA